MAPNLAILTTLALLLFSGCIGGPTATTEDADPPADGTDPTAEPSTPQEEPSTPPTPPAELPGCKANGNSSNYGSQLTIGDTYVFSPRGDNLVVVYEESNGKRGLQTEGECPTAPDRKIAEVPYPVGSLKA